MEQKKSLGKPILLIIAAGVSALLLLNFEYFVQWLTPYFYDAGDIVLIEAELAPNQLVIPTLSIRTPIVYVTENNESAFQTGLQNGVVHYPGTAEIGQPGNPFIFGHSSDYPWASGDYKTIFARLPQIKKDDLIIVSDRKGNVFTYKVFQTAVVNPDQTEYLSQHNFERKLLTLQTSYPVGTALRRFIVIAELLSP